MLKRLMPLILLILLVLGWMNTISNFGVEKRNFAMHMEKAKELEDKGIYIDALEEYESALQFTKDPYPVEQKIAQMFYNLKKFDAFKEYVRNMIIKYNYPQADVKMLVDYYLDVKDNQEALEILNMAQKADAENEYYKQMLVELRGTYRNRYIVADEVLSEYNGYFVYRDTDSYGLLDSAGDVQIVAEYDSIMPFGKEEELAPVKKDKEWYYINKDGYKKLVPDRAVDGLGIFSEGLCTFFVNQQYGYADAKFQVVMEPQYDGATAFANQRALVSKGGKWALINEKFEPITDYIFADVIVNDFGVATDMGVFIAREGERFRVYDLDGNKIGDAEFDEAKAFVSGQSAAVRDKELWGFVGIDGNWAITPIYKNAGSFSHDLAPVLQNEVWGYIDTEKQFRIAEEFAVAKSFSSDGYAPVLDYSWSLIQLIR